MGWREKWGGGPEFEKQPRLCGLLNPPLEVLRKAADAADAYKR